MLPPPEVPIAGHVPDPAAVVDLLRQWRAGDQTAFDRLFPLVYDELRRLARAQLRREHGRRSVQPTQLVHEVYLRLLESPDIDWRDRTHFLSVSARVMRRVLVEHARARQAKKRGGDVVRITLGSHMASDDANPTDMLALDTALERLRELDARQADVVELCYFGGLTYPEIAEVVGTSEATVDRDLRHARAWLQRELSSA